MSDFSQLSTKVCTFHCLEQDARGVRAQLTAHAVGKSPMLIMPCLASEFTDPANRPVLTNILSELAGVDYLKRVIIGLDQAGQPERDLLGELVRQAGLANCTILWNDCPACQAVYGQLEQAGVALQRPGKGKNMFLAFGLALALEAGVVGVVDADIKTFTAEQVDRLFFPLVVLDYEFSKAFYARVHQNRLYGRVKRLLLDPLLLALKKKFSYSHEEKFMRLVDYLLSFRYQLSGEVAFRADLLRRMRFAMNWGVEIYTLIEAYRKSSAICQVELSPAPFDHKHQALTPSCGKGGLSAMALDIITTLMNCLIVEEGLELGPTFFPDLAVTYQSIAERQIKKYAHEAAFNCLQYDRGAEEKALHEVFRPSLLAAGEELQSPVRLAERFLMLVNSNDKFRPYVQGGLNQVICEVAARGQGSVYEVPQTPSWERALDKNNEIFASLRSLASSGPGA